MKKSLFFGIFSKFIQFWLENSGQNQLDELKWIILLLLTPKPFLIYDLNGKLIYSKKKIATLNPHIIAVNKWSPGSYVIKIILDDNTHFNKQLLIK